MKRGTSTLRRVPFKVAYRSKPSRTTKSGRVILNEKEYRALCLDVWHRDQQTCQIKHGVEGQHSSRASRCWGRLPYFSTRWCDHIIKRSQGGPDILENLRLACPPCHNWADNEGGKLSERQ